MNVTTMAKRALARPEAIRPYLRAHYQSIKRLVAAGRTPEVVPYLADIVFPGSHRRYLRLVADDGLLKRRINDYDMYLPVEDEGISRTLLRHGIHEPTSINVFGRELERLRETLPVVTVLEIGANIGYFCLFELTTLDETAHVIAIEPVPENADLLRRNLDLNGFDGVPIHRLALSDVNGRDTIHLSEKCNWSRLGRPPRMDSGERVTVETRTADRFVQELGVDFDEVNVVRMDVQGHEPRVIAGMRRILSTDGPLLLFIEIHAEVEQRNELDDVLEPLIDSGATLLSAHTKAYFRPVVEFDSFSSISEFSFDGWDTVQLICRRS